MAIVTENETTDLVGVLISDGRDPAGRDWLELCVRAVNRRTGQENVQIYVETPNGNGGVQALYDAALLDGATSVVLLSTRAIPARDDWLAQLLAAVEGGAAVAGVWEDESLGPDVFGTRVGCVCFAVDFVESNRLRFDDSTAENDAPLISFLDAVRRVGAQTHRFERSGRNSLTGFPGSLYGDIVYFQSEHSPFRSTADHQPELDDGRRRSLADLSAQIVAHEDEFFEWIRRTTASQSVFFVLGMHRSGTSSLTGCLEQCGLFLGDAIRFTQPDQPRGNFERTEAVAINDALLAGAGGTWRSPPTQEIRPTQEQLASITELVSELKDNAPSGLKDPRTLLAIETWLSVVENPTFVGTFRHPEAVARSLWARNRIPHDEAVGLWNHYNEALVRLHRKFAFPLVEFDLTDRDRYATRIAGLGAEVGLQPSYNAILDLLESPLPDRAEIDAMPMPASCEQTYAYLKSHQYEGLKDDDRLETLLLKWEVLHVAPPASRSFDVYLWKFGRRMPRRVRNYLWFGVRKVRRSRQRLSRRR